MSREFIMRNIFARNALLPSGWAKDVLVETSEDGLITNVSLKPNGTAQNTVGILLPSPVNVHSHSFQRAMAGLTESRGPNNRHILDLAKVAVQILNQLTPEHIEKICAFVQMEMLEAGYATNVEFHYIHHQPGGIPYEQLEEMTNRISCYFEVRDRLDLLPVHYQYGGCNNPNLRRSNSFWKHSRTIFFTFREKKTLHLYQRFKQWVGCS